MIFEKVSQGAPEDLPVECYAIAGADGQYTKFLLIRFIEILFPPTGALMHTEHLVTERVVSE